MELDRRRTWLRVADCRHGRRHPTGHHSDARRQIVGIDVATGATLWTMPFETPYFQNIVTPLVYKDTVIMSGLSKSTFAVRPTRQGASWTAASVWDNADVPMYMSSPVAESATPSTASRTATGGSSSRWTRAPGRR